MLGAARIVPEWKKLKSEICQKLQTPKELPKAPVLLSDQPSLVYRASRHPHLMPPICFYPAATTNVFVCFSWGGPGVKQDQARVWLQHMTDQSVMVEKDISMAQRVKVLQISHVSSLHLLATYCDDLHLRLFGDHSQGLQLLWSLRSPHSVTSMCYNAETGELVTGAIGSITFWVFSLGPTPALTISWATRIAGGEFVHCLSVEQEARMLVALCENTIRLYDYQRRAESQAFQVSQGISLTCCSAHWPQGHLYVGDLAGYVKLWSLETGHKEQQFKAHLSAITSMVCRPAVHTLMTASLDGLLKEWGLGTCEPLRRLDVSEPVFQLRFVDEQTFYCRSQHSFSIHTLRNFYHLFNAAGCGLQKLARVPCSPGRARILATTEDGVIRFLSPVTGELLFLTWPFHMLEKALDYAYDPEREELVVTVGTADVYVLDTTTCPSPAKYILQTTEDRDDNVLCLAFCHLGLSTQPAGFVFSGHRSGHVRLVSQQTHHLAERKIHRGGVGALSSLSACGDLSYHSPESTFLCSYGADERIVLSNVELKGSEMELSPMVVIPSNDCRFHNLMLLPGYICALTEQNRVRLWKQATLVPKKINPYWLETSPLHSCSITSFDYCHTLRMLLTGGADGSVRLWDLAGVLLVDFDTSLKVSRVCFANLRGDLLVGCSTNIYFISCIKYLPRGHLKSLAARQVRDDMVEEPLPFLPNFLLSFDMVFVPKYVWDREKTKRFEGMESLTSHKEVVLVKSVARVVDSAKMEVGTAPCPEASAGALLPLSSVSELTLDFMPARTPAKRPLVSPMEMPSSEEVQVPGESVLLLKKHFLLGATWPIAPDGYIPNSVIRARLWPLGTPQHLKCSIKTTKRQRLPPRKQVKVQDLVSSRWWEEQGEERKVKRKLRDQPTSFVDLALPRDLLAEIVAKNWLRHKPSEVTLESVTQAILSQMDDMPLSVYSLCTTCLVQICEAYVLPPQLQMEAAARLYEGTSSKNSGIRQVAWETLGKMELLSRKDVVPLAWALLDEDRQVRDQARSLMGSVAGIADKFVLKKVIKSQASPAKEQPSVSISGMFVSHSPAMPGLKAEGLAGAPAPLSTGDVETLLEQVEMRLTDNLYLVEECPEITAGSQEPGTKQPKGAELLGEEAGSAGTQVQVKWLKLLAQTKLPKSPDALKDAHGPRKRSRPQDKLPKIHPEPQHLTAPIRVPRGSEAERRKVQVRAPDSHSSEVPRVKLPKVARPHLGKRQDTHDKLYKETLKRQMLQKKRPDEPLPSQLSQTSAQAVHPEHSDPFLIDPGQQYGASGSRWRDALCKLLNLRIAPSADDRSVLEEMLASAHEALAKRSSSRSLGKSSSSFFRDSHKRYSAEEREQLEQLVARLGSCLAEETLAKKPERALAEDEQGGLAKGASVEKKLAKVALTKPSEWALAKRAEGSLAKVALTEGVLVKGAEEDLAKEPEGVPAEQDARKGALAKEDLAEGAKGGLTKELEGVLAERNVPKGALVEGGLAKEPEGVLAERAMPKGALVEGGLAKETEGVLAEWDVPKGALVEGGLTKEPEGVLAEWDVPKGALVEGGLTKELEGVLAEGVLAEWDVPKGALAEGGLVKEPEAFPAEGDMPKGALAEGALAERSLAEGTEGDSTEGAERVLGGKESKVPVAWEEDMASSSPGIVTGGIEGQVWQRLQSVLEILAEPAKLEHTNSSKLVGQLQALRQCPSTEHRVALESTLAMAAQVLGEEDANLGRAVSLCALLASHGQKLPKAAVSMELRRLLQAQPCPDPHQMKEQLASTQARLQASAERMAQEWVWWEEVAGQGQSSLEPATLGRDEEEETWLKVQPPPYHLGKAGAEGPRLLQQHGAQASRLKEREKPAPVDSQWKKVDLYLPARLPYTAGSWAEAPQRGEVGATGLLREDVSWDKLLALYQVLVALKHRHGSDAQAWREQFRRLAKLYGLQWPLSHALIRQLGAADQRGSESIPAKAMREAQGHREAVLGQRILYQVLQRTPQKLPKPPTFCGVIPLNYQNNVHALQPLGEAQYGAMALAWRTVQQDGQGQLPKLNLGVR